MYREAGAGPLLLRERSKLELKHMKEEEEFIMYTHTQPTNTKSCDCHVTHPAARSAIVILVFPITEG